jgi:MFS transporter, DHA1 family, tetracycline resistance protein
MPARKAALSFIFVTLFLDVLGLGLIIPVGPRLIESFVGSNTAEASKWSGWLVSVYAVVQFVFSPIVGSLSDRFGRRPVLLASTFGQGLDYLLLAFTPSLWLFFVGRIIAGLTGASISTATAYIADVTPPEKRAQSFGLIGAAFGLGFVVGPALGGLLGHYSLRLPFLVAAGLTLLNVSYGFFVLPESLRPENRRAFSLTNANPFGTLLTLSKYPVVLSLAATLFLSGMAQRALESTWVLSTKYRYGWDSIMTGLSLTAVGVGAAVVQGFLGRKIIPALGERKTLVMALAVQTLANLCYGLAPQGWMVFCVLPLAAFGGLAMPASQGLMSKSVPADRQGMLQGGSSSLISLTQIIGPPLATHLFAFFISPEAPRSLPGAPFFFAACFLAVALLLAVIFGARVESNAGATPASSLR